MDETINLDNAIKFAESLGGKAKDEAVKWFQTMKDGGKEIVSFSAIHEKMGEEVTKALHAAAQAAQNLFTSFLSLSSIGIEVKEKTSSAVAGIAEIFKQSDIGISNAVMGTFDLLGVIDKSITGMGKLGESGLEASAKMTTAFKSVSPVLNSMFGNNSGIMNFTNAVIEGRDRVISLERELIGMALSQGRVADVSDDTAHRFKDMNESYTDYVNMSIKAATETGQTVASMMDLNKALSAIPGSLSSAEETVKASRLAAAAGMQQLDVAKQLADMYTRLGTSEKDAIENMAYMHDKAGDSKLRFESFNQTVLSIAGSFKMLGDNTNATTNFVNAFDKAFADSKISPEAMKEVITDIGQGIEKMDVAKQAFISGASGGPGGLAGAAQIQELMATGHMDEVIKKTMTVMQAQFGGQIVTRKEAAQNPALAGEWFKQTQYLTQTAGIAKDEKEANRILEAMKTGVMDMFKPGAAEGEKGLALEKQLGRGASLQEKTQTTLMSIHQTLEAGRLRQDQFYSKEFADVDKQLQIMANSMGLVRDNREGRGAVHAGVRALARGEESAAYKKPDWDEMLGSSFSLGGAGEKAKTDFNSFLTKMSGGKTPAAHEVAESTMMRHQPPPGATAGISHIAPTHRPESGLPALPDVNKVTLPTLPTLGENEAAGTSSIEHKFKDMNVNLTIDLGDHKVFNEMIRAQIQQEDDASNRQLATGRR